MYECSENFYLSSMRWTAQKRYANLIYVNQQGTNNNNKSNTHIHTYIRIVPSLCVCVCVVFICVHKSISSIYSSNLCYPLRLYFAHDTHTHIHSHAHTHAQTHQTNMFILNESNKPARTITAFTFRSELLGHAEVYICTY